MAPHQVHIYWSGVTAAWAGFLLYYHGFLFVSPLLSCPDPTLSFFFFQVLVEDLNFWHISDVVIRH